MYSHCGRLVWHVLILVLAGALPVRAQSIVINELMAANGGSVLTAEGLEADWIELYNPTDSLISLAGLYLSDRADDPTQWQFPTDRAELTTLPAGGYALVWASGGTGSPDELHTSFSLGAGGETLLLIAADGQTVLDQVDFPAQSADVSFGRTPDGTDAWHYLYEATPGAANGEGYNGYLSPVTFDVERGFYDAPITVTLASTDDSAMIFYTLDGSAPVGPYADPLVEAGPNGLLYRNPIEIGETTCLRAIAVRAGWRSSPVVSHSYIFPDQVLHQSNRPAGFPTSWGSRSADYAMDSRVVNDPAYAGEIKQDLLSIPTVSLTLANADMFGPQGIYANPLGGGEAWERPVGMEWIDPNTGAHFNVNAGLRIHGGQYSRNGNAKKAMRLLFKTEYGPSTLQYPLFEDSKNEVFNTLVLRSIWNYSWTGDSNAAGGMGADNADYLRDVFARDTVRDMGRLTPYGRPIHLYINGLYWGLYIMTERPDESFAAAHLGGEDTDYDVVKASNDTSIGIETVAGDREAWDTVFDLAAAGLESTAAYEAIQRYVDVPAMIDYMLMIYYTGSRDAPVFLGNSYDPRNFYAIRSHTPEGPYTFAPWDVEWALESPTVNRVDVVGIWNPHLLMSRLADNPAFKTLLADRIHARFFNGGVLTPERVTERYTARADEIYGAIVCESARWGDALRSTPYTREDWLNEVDRLVNQYFSVRTDIVLDQLRAQGWYPSVDAPRFLVNGVPQQGGLVGLGDILTLEADAGTIYYTLDGTDPSLATTQGEESAVALVPEYAPKRILVPTHDIGTAWRGGGEPFDDSAWTDGTFNGTTAGGVGYERSSGYQSFIAYDVEAEMYGRSTSCYIRIAFTVEQSDLDRFNALTLRVRCDDGCVVFLNGAECAAINRPNTLTWNSDSDNRPDSTAWVTFVLDGTLDRLHAGHNILAVHALNQSPTSSDFLFSAELIGSERAQAEVSPTALPYEGPIAITGQTHIKARVLDGQWSALNEAVFTLD